MKKLFVLFVILTMAFASCQTPQKKGEKFAESYVKSSLYIPESYENIATTVDTAYYSPVLDPEVLALAGKIVKGEKDLRDLEYSLKSAKRKVSLWSNPYSSYARNELEEARQEYATASADFQAAEEQVKSLTDELKAAIQSAPERHVVGWLIQTRYRAETNAGDKLIKEALIVVSDDFSQVLFAADSEDSEFTAQVEKVLEIMEGE